jgi:GGDEF domain-containing protein
VLLTARRVTTPLRALVRAAERLGAGDYDSPMAQPGRHDEIGELAKAFDRMRVNIAASRPRSATGLPGPPDRPAQPGAFRERRAAAMITRVDPRAASLAVLMLDLDRFKHVNDVLGYAFGDRCCRRWPGG